MKHCKQCGKPFNGRSERCNQCKMRNVQKNNRHKLFGLILFVSIFVVVVVSVMLWLQKEQSLDSVESPTVASISSSVQSVSVTASLDTSESQAESASSTSEVSISKPVAISQVQQLFEQHFGKITGEHALYFKQLTDATGQEISAKPLVIQQQTQRSASVIKLFVLVALMQKVAANELDLADSYVLQAEDKVGGTGQL